LTLNGTDEVETLFIDNGQLRAKPILRVMKLRARFSRQSLVVQSASKQLQVVKTRMLMLVMKHVQRQGFVS
jgi:hypothetical protein